MNIIKSEIDISMVSETKTDNSFAISQFTMTGYLIPFRLDRTSDGGRILFFVREDISCKIIKTDCDDDFDGIFVETNLRKKKLFLCCSYNPHKSNIANHLHWANLVQPMTVYKKGGKESFAEFLKIYNLRNLVK